MFSPAELLKQYLGDAFNLEGVPDANNVRTWEKERHDLARNVLNILRSNNSGRFQLDDCPKLLIDHSSRGNVRLHDAFASYVEVTVLRRCNDALAALIKSNDEPVRRQALSLQRTLGASKQIGLDDVLRLLDQASNLQVEAKRLGNEIVTELNKIINLLLNTHRQLLREIALALPKIRAEVEDDEDDEDEEAEEVEGAPATSEVRALHALTGALRGWARAIADGRRSISGRSGRIIDLLGSRLPDDQRFGAIGVRIATRSQLRTIVQAPRDFVLGAPRMYAQFRREALRKAQHFSAGEETGGFVARNRITRDEVDVLLLTMLRNARRLLQYDIRRLDAPTPHDWLETIKGRYLLQVFVDEATDLSAVQLACTVELAHPKVRSWFASGDLRQRVTVNGIAEESEIGWLNDVTSIAVEVRKIDIGYRQSQRLRGLSDALAELLMPGSNAKTKAPRGSEEADVRPILGENLADGELARWLAARIDEVEQAVGRLPSIAVFVDGDDLIDPLVASTRDLLAERNIPLVGCKEGHVVGDAREVRVFDIKHIKGLEFEAVFFVGIDRLAARIPDLFHRFLYVGVTRAATYLGVTSKGTLPRRLETVRPHFTVEGWTKV